MDHKKVCLRSTNAQINFLINYMSSHKNFANAIYDAKLGIKSIDEEWKYLRSLLTQHGPDKSVEQWKQTWRDVKRKARREEAGISAKTPVKQEKDLNRPVVSESTIKVLKTIGREIPPECNVKIKPTRDVRLAVRRRHPYMAPDPTLKGDFLQVQKQTNTLLQKLCELMSEQILVLKERNQIERRKLFYSKRRR